MERLSATVRQAVSHPPQRAAAALARDREPDDRKLNREPNRANIIHYMDKLVGRLLDEVNALGIRGNTAYVSDANADVTSGLLAADGTALPGEDGYVANQGYPDIHHPDGRRHRLRDARIFCLPGGDSWTKCRTPDHE